MSRNIGIKVEAPKAECTDHKCPFHGNLKCHGNSFTGVVTSTKMQRTASVEWTWRRYLPKYERYELRRTKVKAHNTACINAVEGDVVKIMGCRPLSKSKNFVIIEKVGKDKAYIVKKETSKIEEEKQQVKENAADKSKNN